MEKREADLKLLTVLTGIFVTVLVLVPSAASKFVAVGRFNLSGATLVFPISYIFNDVLTEVYGYARSRRIIWTGLACQVLAALTYWLVGVWPPAPFWHNQPAYDLILGAAPRITLASLTAYLCGEFANSVVLSKMKYRHTGQRGMKQGWRFVVSTIVGEAIDSFVFMSVGFLGVLATTDVITTMISIYVAKVLYEIVSLPVSVKLANWIKLVEGVDKIDYPEQTNYNPFAEFFEREESRLGPSQKLEKAR
jgi:uncharacterized integral membrane protein (TIGR00697 family)